MRLKMAENSLFAILLRSRWWISLLIALGFAGVSKAVLPAEYFVFGALGGFPFLIIAFIALARQWRAPSQARVSQVLAQAQAMSTREFEAALTQAWQRRGYAVKPAGHSGADLLLARDGRTTVVSFRRWKAAHHGVEPLRELAQARRAAQATDAVYLASGALSPQAAKLAREEGVSVLDAPALATLLA